MLARIDAWQRRHGPAAFLVAVLKKFGEDRASSHAGLIAYYAFLSLFPLLLAFVRSLVSVTFDDEVVTAESARSRASHDPPGSGS
jgi:membrane protein